MRFFCRFFAQSVLFFIKLFYLCTDFRVVPVRDGVFGGGKRAKIKFFEKSEKKVARKFCSFKNNRLLCTSIGCYMPM